MPALDFTLRAFEPEDFPALTGLLNQPRVVWGTLQLPFASVADRRSRAESRHPELQLVALAGTRLVGNLTLMRLELTVWADNEPAIRIYERQGFQCEGRGRAYGFRDGRYEDALFMARLG